MKKPIYLIFAAAILLVAIIIGYQFVALPQEPVEKEDQVDPVNNVPEELEPFTFTHYYHFVGRPIRPWGEDETSKYIAEKFNVHIEFTAAETDPATELSIKVASGDLPDSIMIPRGEDKLRLVDLGLLNPLGPLMEAHDNLEDNVLPTALDRISVDGVLYGIPHYPRKRASGGGFTWIYNRRLFEDAGSPNLNTLEDLYNFAKTVRDKLPYNREGLSVTPVQFVATPNAWQVARAFYRSFGGMLDGLWYTVLNGNYTFIFRDPIFKEAVMEANRWWRERLFSETQFTDTPDMILERIVAGRTALLFYNMALEEMNRFRTLLMESFPDDSYEITAFPYPPARGLDIGDIYGDHQVSVGGAVTVITEDAQNPQKIFDFWSWFLTREANIMHMFGPQGHLWETLNEDGFPILKRPMIQVTAEERTRLGLWSWADPAQSDHLDSVKFAVNNMQPPEKREWVTTNQELILTPTLLFTDEFVGVFEAIDPKSTEEINRTRIMEYINANFPLVIMASTAEEAERIFNDILAFADQNGMTDIEEIKNQKYQENVRLGGTVFDR